MYKQKLLGSIKDLDTKQVRYYLEAEPELLRITDKKGQTLLHLACNVSTKGDATKTDQQVEVAKYLISQGLAVDTSAGDTPPVMWYAVARARNRKLVNFLNKQGARPLGLFASAWPQFTQAHFAAQSKQ